MGYLFDKSKWVFLNAPNGAFPTKIWEKKNCIHIRTNLALIKLEKFYVHNIITTNPKWWIVISCYG